MTAYRNSIGNTKLLKLKRLGQKRTEMKEYVKFDISQNWSKLTIY